MTCVTCSCMFVASFIAYIVVGPIWICRGVNHPFTVDAFNMGCADGGLMSVYTDGPTVIFLQKVCASPPPLRGPGRACGA